jgi:hypothetical protein
MKKTLITSILAVALAGSAFAQGTVTFVASGSLRPISYSDTGSASNAVKFAVGAPAVHPTQGQLNIAAYAASQGTVLGTTGFDNHPNLVGWVLAAPIIHNITAIPGNVVGTTMTMDASLGAPGTTVQITVVGWTGAFASFDAAYQAGAYVGWTGNALNGGSLSWTQLTGTSTTAQVMITGAGGFNGLTLAPVPEPGTIALGGLGVAALLLFRRRK